MRVQPEPRPCRPPTPFPPPKPPRNPFRGLSRRARIGIGAALALVAAIIVFLVVFDWNWLRGPVSRYASAQMQREVTITGDLRVHPWSFQPKAEVYGVRIGHRRPGPRRSIRRPARWPGSSASRCRSRSCRCCAAT
ncbi:hypothetical protein ACRAWD_13315 [Caulobacter segnis]